jgi:hypothetical protein
MSKKVFIRESSGLVRQMGSKHAFAKVLALIVPISLYYTLIYLNKWFKGGGRLHP